jgi:hypothetical protein
MTDDGTNAQCAHQQGRAVTRPDVPQGKPYRGQGKPCRGQGKQQSSCEPMPCASLSTALLQVTSHALQLKLRGAQCDCRPHSHQPLRPGPGGDVAREVTWERPMMTAAPDVKPAVTECDRKLVRKPRRNIPMAVYMHATMKDSWIARWLYWTWTPASSADTSFGLAMFAACMRQ